MLKVTAITTLALAAFAGNSMLCRLALRSMLIDAGSFTVLRLVSGALSLLVLTWFINRHTSKTSNSVAGKSYGSWLGGFSLFIYAVFFSYAYVNLDTATGALILFGCVQISLIVYSIIKGARLSLLEGFGFAVSCGGFVYLLLPELSKPSAIGLALMALSGFAWAIYTLCGQGSTSPLKDTAHNFVRSLPFAFLLLVLMSLGTLADVHLTVEGGLLAVASGVITSGLGYALWYSALRSLSTTIAAVTQLSVPILAAILGLLFIGEEPTVRLLLSAFFVLGGIFMVILAKRNYRV